MASLVTTASGAPAAKEQPPKYPTYYRTIAVDGLSIFYREAGPKDGPTILLLHGLPSSSRMFEPLFDRLADRYHLVAPDYPGFGHSDWPNPKEFAYTFDRYAEIMARFTEALAIPRYTLYMQDYGGPVGFRMVLTHPERVQALIVQDAVAHNEGLGENWKTRRAFWADRKANESALRTNLLSFPTTRTRHVGNDPNVERYDPICGPTSLPSSTSLVRSTFKRSCFTTTAPMWKRTRNGRHGCGSTNHGFWCSGASTIFRLIHLNRRLIAAMCRTPKCTCWTRVTSHWIPPPTRSRH
jgi:pimeloyl-ACP methyl ester carboxylesterase